MFYSEPMQRVRIYADSEAIGKLIPQLYEFGAIHITKARSSTPGIAEYGAPLDNFKDISTMLIAIRAAEKNLGLPNTGNSIGHISTQDLAKQFNECQVEKANLLANELEQLSQKLSENKKKIEELSPFEKLAYPSALKQAQLIDIVAFETRAKKEYIEKTLSKAKAEYSLEISTDGKTNTCVVAFEKSKAQIMNTALGVLAVKMLQIPVVSTSFSAEIAKIKSEIEKIQSKLTELSSEISKIKREKGSQISRLRAALEIESKKSQITFNFASTKNLVIVEGWVPKKNLAALENYTKKTKQAQLSHVELLKTSEIAPTKLKNPAGLSAFEQLVSFFSLPLSNELDPTALVAITFPLFFGMIVGDVGYGLISFLLALAIKTKAKDPFIQAIGTMLLISSISSIIFGFVFGEFFGFDAIFGYQLHALIHRTNEHGLILLMGYSLLFGMLQLGLGYALGAYNELQHKNTKHALAKISWLVLEFAMPTYIITQSKIEFLFFLEPLATAVPPIIMGGLALLAVIGIAVFEGPIALFEIPGLISNIFSYLRIMALGLAGVIIVLILNKIPPAISFSDPLSSLGGIALLLLYVVGHIGSLALALFESMIQSMRLQYVEFFSKFFHGGGIQFTPFNSKAQKA